MFFLDMYENSFTLCLFVNVFLPFGDKTLFNFYQVVIVTLMSMNAPSVYTKVNPVLVSMETVRTPMARTSVSATRVTRVGRARLTTMTVLPIIVRTEAFVSIRQVCSTLTYRIS